MKILQGIGASPGLAIGPVCLFQPEDLSFVSQTVTNLQAEWAKIEASFQTAASQLDAVYEKAVQEAGEIDAAIFEAQKQMLFDPEFIDRIRASIFEHNKNAETALMDTAEHYAKMLESLTDDYFRARAADVRDVARRVLQILLGKSQSAITLEQPSVIVARDLTPSDTVRLDKTKILGFCTAQGGATSHTAILAKALGLPAIVGVGEAIETISQGDCIILNGHTGQIILNPDDITRQNFEKQQSAEKNQSDIELLAARQPAITKDGKQVEIVANVGSVADAEQAIRFGAEGIGLLRTEFLYLDRQTAPTEDEQEQGYRAIFDVMGQYPTVIRTLDVGGDKALPYIDLGHEDNPFLGWRAIRMCLDNPEFFKTQLRAILRAAIGHDIRIMFPMIATVSEVKKAKNLLDEARNELQAQGIPYGENIQVGIMVEIPAAAIMADKFIGTVDFFSIGTNDLTQYTLAVERTNKKVGHLSNALDPAVLRLIAQVIREGHRAGIWVGMCGELAGDPKAIPVLLGLGLDEFSMAPALIPHAKAIIRELNTLECEKLAQEVLDMETFAQVEARLLKKV